MEARWKVDVTRCTCFVYHFLSIISTLFLWSGICTFPFFSGWISVRGISVEDQDQVRYSSIRTIDFICLIIVFPVTLVTFSEYSLMVQCQVNTVPMDVGCYLKKKLWRWWYYWEMLWAIFPNFLLWRNSGELKILKPR